MSTKETLTKGGGAASTSQGLLTLLRVCQIVLALLLFSTVWYIGEFATMWPTPNAKPTNEEVEVEHLVHLNNVFETRGPNRYYVPDFDAAETYLRTVNLTDGPLFVLLMSGETNGTYWCADCERAKGPVADALARAPANTRLLEVSVGTAQDWHDDFNSFRSKSTFHIRKIPALLQYAGNLHTTRLISERFTLDTELLDFAFGTKGPAPRAVQTIRNVEAMTAYLDAYDGSHALFLSFTSGINSHTGRLWCPFCDIADLPLQYYFEQYAPPDAVMLRIVVADSYGAWKNPKNPFRLQTAARVTGLPTLSRVSRDAATKALAVREYTPFFENRAELVAFFQADK
ncbi:Aste57867_23975 [Aphanomyces stellatus]|uniref:Aste57867_23975 protein n=1 Tax=Aphanomyces stellatus TaxID=120398 RepID=A0A485LPF8_9STRA|nr:hypothetical protein As57867_023902 [Aphanomyces stellatus]VFU00618.1 Aste57867_23975 [Aphanomyces stellatus]